MSALRAVLYVRLSVSDDASTSIMRQEADLRELAAREGWEVVRVLVDDGLSGRKVRANAEESLRMLRAGEADVLAVWKLDRFTRQGARGVGALVETLDETPGALFVALMDGLRSDQSAWRLIASVLGEVARTEAENTALRVRADKEAGKKAGRYTGGTIPYGYRPIKNPDGVGRVLVLVPEEVATIHGIAKCMIAGDRVSHIVQDLNARHVPTARSNYRRAQLGLPMKATDDPTDTGKWGSTLLQAMMTSDVLLGRTTHRGQLVRDANGLPVQFWDPVLDLDTLTAVRAVVRNPRKPYGYVAPPPRRRAARLLSGIAYCEHCGTKMYVNTSGRKPVYACPKYLKGCPEGPRMTAEIAERYVEGLFLSLVSDVPEVELIETADDPETAASLSAIEEALREAGAELLFQEGDTSATLSRIEALKARRTTLRATPPTVTVHARPTGRTLGEAWAAESDVHRRRQVLLRAMDHVTISRLPEGVPTKGQHGARRVAVKWRS